MMMLLALIIPQGAIAQTQEDQQEITFATITEVAETATGETAIVSPITWGGNGKDSEDCDKADENRGTKEDGWIHWVVNTKGDSSNPELVLGGTGSGSYQPGEPLNANVWHFYTPYFDVDGLEATLYFEGELGRPGSFRISDYCPGQEPEPEFLSISPVLECVTENDDGTFTAHWGYVNHNDVTVDAQDSYFTGGVLDGSEPMSEGFLPGRQVKVFETQFDGENLVWTLTGPDGETSTATASSNSQRCGKTNERVSPVLECVEDLGDGIYRAWFGYLSDNDVPVEVEVSKLTGTVFNNDEPKTENFLPGRHRKVFSITFDGSNLVWTVKGPDGKTRTSTASSNSKRCEPKEEGELLPLTVESICSGETGILSKWVVSNPNDEPVTFDWVIKDDPTQNGTATAPANGMVEIQTDMVMGTPNTFEMTIDDKVIAVTDRFCYNDLELVAICTDDPEITYNWKVNNPNPYSVEVTWKIMDSEQMGTITVPGNGSNTFSTIPVSGESDIAIISVNGKVQNTGEGVVSSRVLCTQPEPEDPVDETPPGDDGPITTIIVQDPPQETVNIPDTGVPALPSDDVLLDEVIEFEEEPAPAAPVAPPLPDTGGVSAAVYVTAGLFLIMAGTIALRRREV